jgi:tetratricopeptide (TPR) repeat protein
VALKATHRTIYGVVKDSRGMPLGGAKVAAAAAGAARQIGTAPPTGNAASVTTDDDGFFKIDGVGAEAQVQITVEKTGYSTETRVSTPAEAGKKLDIFLARQFPPATPTPPRAGKPSPPAAAGAGRVDPADSRSAELARVAYQTLLGEEFREAETIARQALALDSENVLANAVLGNALAVLGANTGDAARLAGAAEFIAKALQHDANQALAYNARGITLATSARYDEAAAALQRAIQLDPRLGAAHANLAYVFQQQQRLDLAEREYREAIKLQPEGAVAYNNLSTVLFDRKRYRDAIKASRDAISRYQLRDGFLGRFYVQLAIAQFQDGRQSEALEAIARAKTLGITQHEAFQTIESGRPERK